MAELTPMMKQYIDIKNKHKDAIVLYRLGDFYEMFFDDAILASKELEITLTGRDCGQEERAPMCGVPFHSVEGYISKLIEKGHKVVICEQVEDPAVAKGIVKRDVVRIVTPGTIIDTNMLEDKKNNYIACIYSKEYTFGFSYADSSTGEIYVTEIETKENFDILISEITKVMPTEILVSDKIFSDNELMQLIKEKTNSYISKVQEINDFDISKSFDNIKIDDSFKVGNKSANILINYIKEMQKGDIGYINKIQYYYINNFMSIDSNTRRNLELLETSREKNKRGSLLWVLDKTETSMGGRLIRKWIESPLISKEEIEKRLDSIEEIINNIFLRDDIVERLKKVYDIERIIGRIVYGNTNARDFVMLKNSLKEIPNIKRLLRDTKSNLLNEVCLKLDTLEDVVSLISNSIVDEPPITIKEGNIIRDGYNRDVDNLREATTNGKNWILEVERKEKEITGIKNLKVGFNKVFGYYMEVTKLYQHLVPDRYIRKQTLSNCERYITEELKEIEDKILTAETKITELEYNIFQDIRKKIISNTIRIQNTSNMIAVCDVLCSLANVAISNNYTKPNINNNGEIIIENGRHPVVEKAIKNTEFVPNDTLLNMDTDNYIVITGPNMAGKSTYMRQVALLTLMAQIGSFIPAQSANISIVDKIFTRVGASDDLAMGQSTFMVEMLEVANILKNATSKSLVILDEIGRGTSTYDGLSIAWAVTEYIANNIKCKTLFATHYHELTELESKIIGIKNYSVDVLEKGEDVIFLHKISKGKADGSYGVHVAKIAGVPKQVITRSNEILKDLELADINTSNKGRRNEKYDSQFDIFNYKLGEVEKILNRTDLNNITPIEALSILSKLKEKID